MYQHRLIPVYGDDQTYPDSSTRLICIVRVPKGMRMNQARCLITEVLRAVNKKYPEPFAGVIEPAVILALNAMGFTLSKNDPFEVIHYRSLTRPQARSKLGLPKEDRNV